MRKNIAALITTGLTVFVLGTGGLLAKNLARPTVDATPAVATVIATSDTTTIDTLIARDAVYQARLEEANQTIAQANAALASMEAEQARLAGQNQTLLEREAAFRQAIERANALLQQQAAAPLQAVAAAAPTAAAPAAVETPSVSEPAYSDDDRDEADRHDDDREEDDHAKDDHSEGYEEHDDD